MKNPFDIFDKIICICGKHEEDRWIKVQSQFDSVGILDRIDRFDEVIDANWLTETYGKTSEWSKTDYCHWKIISDAHTDNLKNVFIFESDIEFISTDKNAMQKSVDSLELVDWKLFFMGGIPHSVFRIVNEHLINTSMCQAHAYAINGNYCEEVAEKLMESKIAIDQVYKRGKRFDLARKSFASYPRFVHQNDPKVPKRQIISRKRWNSVIEPRMGDYKSDKS
jgi:hypothetical protein